MVSAQSRISIHTDRRASYENEADHRPKKLILKRRFEEPVWKKTKTFGEYVHHKIILANQVQRMRLLVT